MTFWKNLDRNILKGINVCIFSTLVFLLPRCTLSPIPAGPTKSEITISTETSPVQPQPQHLRITNQGDLPLYDLTVIFPSQRIEFGDVPVGATTSYQEASHGVYRYAAYAVEVDGKNYEQPVIDWVGEAPMQGKDFTFILEADPARWEAEGQVIRLVQVVEDQAIGDSIPSATASIVGTNSVPNQPASTLTPFSTEEVDLPILAPSLQIGKGSATALAVSPDGNWMAVGTQFGVYQYYTNSLEQAWFTPLAAPAGALVFDPQGHRLGVSAGNNLVLLDVETGIQAAILENAGGRFAWSPDGDRLVSGGGCEQVTVWDTSRGAALKELRGGRCSEGYSNIHVTWAPDGRVYGAAMGAKILAWDGDTYTPIEDFSAEGAPDTWVSALIAAPAGGLLAQYDWMGLPVVAIIDGQQDRQVHLLDRQVNGGITALAWAPDGRRLAVNYRVEAGLTLIWNALTGQVEQEIEGFYAAAGLDWSPDGRTLFGLQSLDGQIQAVEVSTGRSLRGLDGHVPAGSFLTWTQDGLASTDGATLTWWDPDSGQPLRRETVGSPQAWLISWPPAGPDVFLYADPLNGHHVGTDRYRRLLEGDEGQYPFPSAWSWDGSRLADPTRVWDARSGELLARLHDPAQQHTPDKVAWAPDGERLASADSLAMQPPVIWNARSGEVLLSLNSDTKNLHPIWLGLAWSPDGKHLAAVGALRYPDGGEYEEGMILIWNAETGGQEQLLTEGMQDYRLWTAAWSPDGRFLACGTTGREIFLWGMAGSLPLAKLGGHTDISDQLAWSPDGSRLASVARDGTLLIWDLASIPTDAGENQ